MSCHFDAVVGNVDLVDRLCRDVDEGSLSHAYILEGPSGTGRHTLALSVAAALSCEHKADSKAKTPCGKCRNCQKIFSGNSPDIISIGLEGDRASIGVEAIRQMKNDIYIAPNDLDFKIYIINNSDSMTPQAQNAFLLSLEEPPEYIIFFLICENSTSLLETVRSRAPSLRTQRLSDDEVKEHLLKTDRRAISLYEESPDEFASVIKVGAGRIGYALSLLDTKHRKSVLEQKKTARNIISMISSSDRGGAFEVISTLGNKRQDVCRQLSYLEEAVRDLILLKKDEAVSLCFFEDAELACELASNFTSEALFALYDAAAQAISDLEANANVRLALMNMMQRARLI